MYCQGEINFTVSDDGSATADNIGGFCGGGYVYANDFIRNSYSDMTIVIVLSNNDLSLVGGFCGFMQPKTLGSIENCYSTGQLSISGTTNIYTTGGFIGQYDDAFYTDKTFAELKNCAWFSDLYSVAIGNATSVSTPIALLATNSNGTDEPDNTKFYPKTHAVYAQGT